MISGAQAADISPNARIERIPAPNETSSDAKKIGWGFNDVSSFCNYGPAGGAPCSLPEIVYTGLKGAGMDTVRMWVFWDFLSTKPGEMDHRIAYLDAQVGFARKHGYKILATVISAPTWDSYVDGKYAVKDKDGNLVYLQSYNPNGATQQDKEIYGPTGKELNPYATWACMDDGNIPYFASWRPQCINPPPRQIEPFKDFIRFLENRYHFEYLEVSNETETGIFYPRRLPDLNNPSNKEGLPDIRDFVQRVMIPGYDAAKEVNPNVQIVGPAYYHWDNLQQFFKIEQELGRPIVDIVDIHDYAGPDEYVQDFPRTLFHRLDEWYGAGIPLNAYLNGRQFWITETSPNIGVSSNDPGASDPAYRAQVRVAQAKALFKQLYERSSDPNAVTPDRIFFYPSYQGGNFVGGKMVCGPDNPDTDDVLYCDGTLSPIGEVMKAYVNPSKRRAVSR